MCLNSLWRCRLLGAEGVGGASTIYQTRNCLKNISTLNIQDLWWFSHRPGDNTLQCIRSSFTFMASCHSTFCNHPSFSASRDGASALEHGSVAPLLTLCHGRKAATELPKDTLEATRYVYLLLLKKYGFLSARSARCSCSWFPFYGEEMTVRIIRAYYINCWHTADNIYMLN